MSNRLVSLLVGFNGAAEVTQINVTQIDITFTLHYISTNVVQMLLQSQSCGRVSICIYQM